MKKNRRRRRSYKKSTSKLITFAVSAVIAVIMGFSASANLGTQIPINISEQLDMLVEKGYIASDDPLLQNSYIQVDGGNLSGYREKNVIVDTGFGDREYFAFTNEHGQLVKVIAPKIVPQNDRTEPVTDKGRYYPDEAKVSGTESRIYDEGHIIADSLGGVANAYNITPQHYIMNRHGNQAYTEKAIRDAGGCEDFVAQIIYPNTDTQIPSSYKFTYTLMGRTITDEFKNEDPDMSVKELNSKLDKKYNN